MFTIHRNPQLTEQHARADSKLAKFVGLKAYEKAGGAVLHDLFDQEGEGWLTDTALLNRLVAEKMEKAAQPVRGEGWKWVEIAPVQTYEDTQQNGRIHPSYAPPTPEQQTEIDRLQADAERIMEENGEEPEDEEAYVRLQELQDKISKLSEGERIWTDEQKAVAGVTLTIGYDGEVSVLRGIVKPEDKAASRKIDRTATANEPPPKEKGGISAALLAELTAHKTTAAQLVLANTAILATRKLMRKDRRRPDSQHPSSSINSMTDSIGFMERKRRRRWLCDTMTSELMLMGWDAQPRRCRVIRGGGMNLKRRRGETAIRKQALTRNWPNRKKQGPFPSTATRAIKRPTRRWAMPPERKASGRRWNTNRPWKSKRIFKPNLIDSEACRVSPARPKATAGGANKRRPTKRSPTQRIRRAQGAFSRTGKVATVPLPKIRMAEAAEETNHRRPVLPAVKEKLARPLFFPSGYASAMCLEERLDLQAAIDGKITWRQYHAKWGPKL